MAPRLIVSALVLCGVLLGGFSTAAAENGERGTLAVVNLGRGHAGVAFAAGRELSRYIGGWAQQQAISAALAGRTASGPSGPMGDRLAGLLRRLRGSTSPAIDDLGRLGRLLAVDYLLLLRVHDRGLSARLFSVGRANFAPQGFERADHDTRPLLGYLRAQTGVRSPAKRASPRWFKRWYVWAAVVGATAFAVGLAMRGANDDTLRIRVHR